MTRAERLFKLRGLYGIVDDSPGSGPPPLPWAEALVRGGALALQLRFKRTPLAEALGWARRIRQALPEVLLLVNDRVDLALLCDADGVHLGELDLPVSQARRLLGPDRLVGATARTPRSGRARMAEGADHLGVGPVFASATKATDSALLGLEGLRAVCRALPEVPVIAISGIDQANVEQVASAGARAFAVIGAVGRAPDPAAAAHQLSHLFARRQPT